MTPAARLQSAIEILDLVIAAAARQGAPADRILADWFRTHRFAGSKDKRAIRDHVYAAIRACGPVPQSGRAAMLLVAESQPDLRALFDGSPHAPAPLADGERAAAAGIAPAWLESALAASGISGAEAEALLTRAPLDIRRNPLAPAAALPDGGTPVPGVDGAWRYPHGTRIEDSEAFTSGAIEVQDAGSQLACIAAGAQAGETVIDLCAGAGGKSLALAAQVGAGGRVIAADTDRGRLSRLPPRAARAGAEGIVAATLLNPGRELEALGEWRGRADLVLVDAPCSGTGTWRRNPEARWRITPGELDRLAVLQSRLLEVAAELVRPGGRLAYVTCSLLDTEGAAQAEAFLAAHPGWGAVTPALPLGTVRGAGLRLSPAADGTDGFFIACFEKPC